MRLNALIFVNFDIFVVKLIYLNYYSYIDRLDLSIDALIDFSPYALNQVTTALNKNNPKDKTAILTGLTDPVSRSYHITIEQNPWLKALLLKDLETLKRSKIELNLEHVNYVYGFQRFLEVYLRPILPEIINHFIKDNALKLLFHVLSQADIFSKACQNDIKGLLKDKISYATNYLGEPVINDPDANITYIKSHYFYQTLNLYKPHFDADVLKLYDTMMDLESQYDPNSDDPVLRFVLQAQVAFKKKQVDDVATKLLIDDNAENAKDHAFKPSSTVVEETRQPVSLTPYIITVIITVFVLGAIVFGVSISANTDGSHKESQTSDNRKKKKKKTYDNRIQFYYSLKLITKKKAIIKDLSSAETEIIPFSNPYPKTFNPITKDTVVSQSINVLVTNNTDSDLIVFKMIKGKDESLYIPKNREIYIALYPTDSLLFLSGKRFVESKFSHFREDIAISDIYKVTEIDETIPSKITIQANDLSKNPKGNIISKKAIEVTEDIGLYGMSIDNLYRNYYYKRAN